MRAPDLRVPPAYVDENGLPCYSVDQEKGLAENTGFQLMQGALAEGYTAAVANALYERVRGEVLAASGGRALDLLEIGGGYGRFFDWVSESARSYINIEPGSCAAHPQWLERLEDPRYQQIRCSAVDLPLHDRSVDAVVSIAALDHVPDYERALAEARRVLRDGGTLVVALNNRRSWWKALLSRTGYLKRREELIAREHYFQWSLAECRDHLARHLSVERIYSTTFFPYVPRIWKYLLPVFDAAGSRLIPRYGANVIAVCRKQR